MIAGSQSASEKNRRHVAPCRKYSGNTYEQTYFSLSWRICLNSFSWANTKKETQYLFIIIIDKSVIYLTEPMDLPGGSASYTAPQDFSWMS